MDRATDLSTLLHCPVCLSHYHRIIRVPRILSCGHTMCQACLHALGQHTAQSGTPLTCPECRQLVQQDRAACPMNYTVLSLLDAACQDCCSRLRTLHCSHCYKWLCDGCMNIHEPDVRTYAKAELQRLRERGSTERETVRAARNMVNKHTDEAATAMNANIDSYVSELETLRAKLAADIEKTAARNTEHLQQWETEALRIAEDTERFVDMACKQVDNGDTDLSDVMQECQRLVSASEGFERNTPYSTEINLQINPQLQSLLPNALTLTFGVTRTKTSENQGNTTPSTRPASPSARLVQLRSWRDHHGYGFSLQSVRGRKGHFIGRVDSGSPADVTGLREGDKLVEVSGKLINNQTHADVVKAIANTEHPLLLVVDGATDDFFQEHGVKVESTMADVISITCPAERPATNTV